jgi:hypothetical protein
VIGTSQAITPGSRDFRPVLRAVTEFQRFVAPYGNVVIWNLTDTIKNRADALAQQERAADQALAAALNQIQTNVETAAQLFVQQQHNGEDASAYWDKVDGREGYKRYASTVSFVKDVLVPSFNDFLAMVPGTDRIANAARLAQSAVSQLLGNFGAFPNFRVLPAPSDEFPYVPYGDEGKQFGEDQIITILKTACQSHFAETGNKLRVGTMQYEHGGAMSPHVSHRRGVDADVDVVEVGDVPNHDAGLALAAAKRFLAAGAALVFYADADVVSKANKWASEQGLSGRLSVEANHKKHFHLRAPQ